MNAGRAARGAGYRGVTAGCQLLKMPVVKAEIEKRLKRRRKRFELTADALLQELCAIAFLDPAEILDENGAILPLAEIPPHVRAAIKDISCGYGENADSEGQFDRTLFVKATFHEKSWAAQLLAKHLGLLADNSKQAGNGNGSHANVLTLEWDKLFEPEPTGADGIEKRLQEEEAKAGLRALPAPSPVVVDAVATPVVASKVKADGTNGKANGKPLGLSPRKTPAK